MKLIINKDRSVIPVGTWGTVNENNYEILEFEFPAELEEYNKRIVYYLGDERVWDTIVNNKAYITNAITTKGDVKAYVWCTKENTEREADTDFRTMLFDMHFYENENADGIVPTEQQVDGFNTMLTAMNEKIDEVDALEQTIETAEAQRQEAEATRVSNENTRQSNESTRQTNEQTRQSQEAERERRTDEAISSIQDKTAEYNANAEAKTTAFNNNATQKTNQFNSNYTQKVNDFNTNANNQKTDFNSNASSKTSAFNSNAETKTNAFNTNATNKTNDFNNNATEKTTAFNNNASTKTSEFNTNAESKTTEFNDNATSKTNDFNDNAAEKTTAFNENAQEKIDEYDEHIVEYQAQIDELQEEVEELSENMPWNTTEQATEITVDDAAKYSRNKLELFGNTEQTQYTGKNLFNVVNSHFGWGSYDFKLVDNIITISVGNDNGGLAAGSQGKYTDFNFDTNKEYYFSVYRKTGYLLYKETSTTKWSRVLLYIKYEDGSTSNLFVTITSTTEQVSKKITFTEGKTPVAYAIGRYLPGNTLENNQSQDFYVQLEEGSTATDYEPYTNGPSPNPDYPQDIHVVSGENIIEVQGKNLFDKNNANIKSLNASFTNEGYFSGATNQKHVYIKCKPNTRYTISKKYSKNWTEGIYITEKVPATGVWGKRLYWGDFNIPRTVLTPDNAEYLDVRLTTSKGETEHITEILEGLQIEEGSIGTDYVSYYHEDYSINLGDIKLCEIENYKDKFVKDNGVWKIPNKIIKIDSYNGETITTPYISTTGGLDIGATIYYVGNAEYIITDETLIAQLDAIYEHLQLVKGTNNITVTAEDLAPNMQLSYMQDLPTKLNNLASRIELLEE